MVGRGQGGSVLEGDMDTARVGVDPECWQESIDHFCKHSGKAFALIPRDAGVEQRSHRVGGWGGSGVGLPRGAERSETVSAFFRELVFLQRTGGFVRDCSFDPFGRQQGFQIRLAKMLAVSKTDCFLQCFT